MKYNNLYKENTLGYNIIFSKYFKNRYGLGTISLFKYFVVNLRYLFKLVNNGSKPKACSTILYLFKNLKARICEVFFVSFTSFLLLFSFEINNSNFASRVFFLTKLVLTLSISLCNSSLVVEIIAPLILQSGNLVIEFILILFKLERILNGEIK